MDIPHARTDLDTPSVHPLAMLSVVGCMSSSLSSVQSMKQLTATMMVIRARMIMLGKRRNDS